MYPSDLLCFRYINTVHKDGNKYVIIIIIIIIIICVLLQYLYRFKDGLTGA